MCIRDRVSTQSTWGKRKELASAQKEYEEDSRRLGEIQNRVELLKGQERELVGALDKLDAEVEEQGAKMGRAQTTLGTKARQFRVNVDDLANAHALQLAHDVEVNKNKTLMSALQLLLTEFPDASGALEAILSENDVRVASKAPSSIDVQSVVSRTSQRSNR
eukprot:TRINITY_DN12273_c0_g2_i3.p1 TRINITY_DN12273_c0_g2~~TRINITY_DN12273_c0_g2_i3.p1  ORF type:complete len:181 (+),score=51.67 TRINITY_DN12273_c0_g2_i3:60-545(+)